MTNICVYCFSLLLALDYTDGSFISLALLLHLVCEYYVHDDCKDFAINDCLETATYVPTRDNVSLCQASLTDRSIVPLSSPRRSRQLHLSDIIIIGAKATCPRIRNARFAERHAGPVSVSPACAASGAASLYVLFTSHAPTNRFTLRSVQTHSTCRSHVIEECNFGALRDIIIPPYAISIPRVANLNKDLILGIGNNLTKGLDNLPQQFTSEYFIVSSPNPTDGRIQETTGT